MSLYTDLMEIRVALLDTELNKSGWNDYSSFAYFELKDIQPAITRKLAEKGLFDHFSYDIEKEVYVLTIHGSEGEIEFLMPYKKESTGKIQGAQLDGANNTYYKKYLYMNAFSITENDITDALTPDGDVPTSPQRGYWQQLVINTVANFRMDMNAFARQYGLTSESPEERFESIYNTILLPMLTNAQQNQPPNNQQSNVGNPF